jgi:hypothetical protein
MSYDPHFYIPYMRWVNLYRTIESESTSIENKYNKLIETPINASLINQGVPGYSSDKEIPENSKENIIEYFKSSIPFEYKEEDNSLNSDFYYSFIPIYNGKPVINLNSNIYALDTNGLLSEVNFSYKLSSKIEEKRSFEIKLPDFTKFKEIIDSQKNRIYDVEKIYTPYDTDRFTTIPQGFIPTDSQLNLKDVSIEYLYVEEFGSRAVLVPLVRVDGNVKTIDGEKSITFWVLAGEVK